MKKHVYGRKFSRDTGARAALFRALVISLVEQGTIETTLPRAKAVKPLIDKAVTLAKKRTLTSRRALLSEFAHNKRVVAKLEEEAKLRFATLSSGFTRMVRVERRLGDNAPMVRLMWSREKAETKDEASKSKTKEIENKK